MAVPEAQADLNSQLEKLSDDVSEIEQTNEDGHVLGAQPDQKVDANLNNDAKI